MNKINCLIVDDEPLALEVLESYIEKMEGLELVGKAGNALEAMEILQSKPVDLLFLDIQMPKMTGIDFLKNLMNPPKVILTTAYRDYALEGFELNVLDYLLKPISFERFFRAVNKYHQNGNGGGAQVSSPETSDSPEVLHLKSDKKMIRLRVDEILYLESLKDYIRVRTMDKEVITHQKISDVETHLGGNGFLRVHRSYIVAINKIEAFDATGVELTGGHHIPIGRNYKQSVHEILNAQGIRWY